MTLVNSANINKPDISGKIDSLCNFLSDMIDYNRTRILNPSNTPQTRSQILNSIETFKSMFIKMKQGFRTIFDKLYIEDKPDLYKKFFVKSLRSYVLYDILEEQFKKNNFYAISELSLIHI